MAEYNWAILGCGVIAHQLADAMKAKGRTLLTALPTELTKRFPLPKNTALKVYGNIEEVFEEMKMSILFIFPLLTTRILNI